MKKRFALYGMFAAMAIFATACGDDSSSGPEEESSSSIEAEDESSSSVEEGKSSAADKKSSSSEAKKGDSSSSEKATSSSSETVSSSSISNPYAGRKADPFCNVSLSGDTVTLEYGIDEFNQRNIFAWNAKRGSLVGNGPDCGDIALFGGLLWGDDVIGLVTLKECSVENLELDQELFFTEMAPFGTTSAEHMEDALKNGFCPYMLRHVIPTEYLNPNVKYGIFIDPRDGLVYKTVKIGNQTWMAQNLNNKPKPSSWGLCYGGDADSCDKYGLLYTWEAAQNACPDGWGLPTKADFEKLIAQIKDNGYESVEKGESSFSGQEQLIAQSRGELGNTWNNVDGTDDFGFSALGAGYYNGVGYEALGDYTDFWAKADDENSAYIFELSKDSGEMLYIEDVKNSEDVKNAAFPVRCIKGDAPAQSVSSK